MRKFEVAAGLGIFLGISLCAAFGQAEEPTAGQGDTETVGRKEGDSAASPAADPAGEACCKSEHAECDSRQDCCKDSGKDCCKDCRQDCCKCSSEECCADSCKDGRKVCCKDSSHAAGKSGDCCTGQAGVCAAERNQVFGSIAIDPLSLRMPDGCTAGGPCTPCDHADCLSGPASLGDYPSWTVSGLGAPTNGTSPADQSDQHPDGPEFAAYRQTVTLQYALDRLEQVADTLERADLADEAAETRSLAHSVRCSLVGMQAASAASHVVGSSKSRESNPSQDAQQATRTARQPTTDRVTR